jgi:hypothetical protein
MAPRCAIRLLEKHKVEVLTAEQLVGTEGVTPRSL